MMHRMRASVGKYQVDIRLGKEMQMNPGRAFDPSVGYPLRGHALDEFLDLGLVARLACHDADGWPYAVPVWHAWDGSGFWVIATKDAAWARWIRSDPRVALCIDEPATLRRVVCQGSARAIEGPSSPHRCAAIARGMAARYLGGGAVAAYETSTAGLERWLFRIEPTRLLTWAGPGRTEGRPSAGNQRSPTD